MSDYRRQWNLWMHDKMKKYVYPKEVAQAYTATGDLDDSWKNDMDAKRHLIGTALMARNKPALAPVLTSLHEGFPALGDAIGIPEKYLGEDYLMDKHNNQLAYDLEAKKITDPRTGQQRKMTEEEMLRHIDNMIKEAKESQSWREGQNNATGQKTPKWLLDY